MFQDVAVRAALTDSSGNFKVYRDLAPEGIQYPFVVWTLINSNAMNNIDCAATEDLFNLQFDVYATSEEERDDISGITRSCVNTFARVGGYLNTPKEFGLYRESFSATTIDAY